MKKDVDGNVKRFKARLVVKGYAKKPGINFDEVRDLLTSGSSYYCLGHFATTVVMNLARKWM